VVLPAATRIRHAFDALNADVALELVPELVGPRPMHRTEMALVGEVLDDLLRVSLDLDERRAPVCPCIGSILGDVWDLPRRLLAFDASIPNEDEAVVLLYRVVLHAGARWDSLGVWHLDALATLVEAPRMKRTRDRLPNDLAAVSEVGAEVRAKSIMDHGLAALSAVEDHLAAEILDRPDIARLQLFRHSDDEPTTWIARKKLFFFSCC